MKRRPFLRSLLAGIALAGATATAVTPAVAAPGKAPDHAVARHDAATTKAEQQRVQAYWTPARMKSAKPADTRFTGEKAPSSARGKKAGNVVQEATQPALGKVFFSSGSSNYVCSGTATTSGNKAVVTTAGHCVNEGPGAFFTNWAFVPAYENGSRPHGTWAATKLFTTTQWANGGEFAYDAGFAVVANPTSGGPALTDAVGSYPIAFNLQRGLLYKSYGYPAATPYNGQLLYSCTGTAKNDPYGSTTQGIPCGMTGGSSGGGWITGGSLNSVNSYKYRADNSTMYGPYFGSVIESAYRTAAGS